MSEDVVPNKEPAKGEERLRTVKEWATEKGHYPKARKPGERIAPLHRGPHGDVVLAHLAGEYAEKAQAARKESEEPLTAEQMRMPANVTLTEAEYDEAVKGAYKVAVGENLADQQAALAAANKRAEAQAEAEKSAGGTSPQTTAGQAGATRRTGAPPPLAETERATQRGAGGMPTPPKDAAHGPGTGPKKEG